MGSRSVLTWPENLSISYPPVRSIIGLSKDWFNALPFVDDWIWKRQDLEFLFPESSYRTWDFALSDCSYQVFELGFFLDNPRIDGFETKLRLNDPSPMPRTHWLSVLTWWVDPGSEDLGMYYREPFCFSIVDLFPDMSRKAPSDPAVVGVEREFFLSRQRHSRKRMKKTSYKRFSFPSLSLH